MAEPGTLERTLEAAQEVLDVLGEQGLEAVLIGATALAIHGYPRETRDLDLAIAADPRSLHEVARRLKARGHQVEVRDPDPDDPLGGVMDVLAPGADPIQVINFSNPPGGGFPQVVSDALKEATEVAPGSRLRVVDLYHLIVFKLYAGGSKSKLDILELLERNPTLDRARLSEMSRQYRLEHELQEVLNLEARG
jgi:hypothetical protein